MIHPDWNENERNTYLRLANPKGGPSQDVVEGLAYTAVIEMYHQRKGEERLTAEKQRIIDAIDQMAEGICTLERILGVDIHKMSERHAADRYEMFRKRREEDEQ